MKDEKYNILLEELREIKITVGDIDLGLEKDRERLQDMSVRLENVETEVKETRQAVNRNVERVQNKVAEAVEPAITANEELKREVKKKNMIFVTEKKNWFLKLFEKR